MTRTALPSKGSVRGKTGRKNAGEETSKPGQDRPTACDKKKEDQAMPIVLCNKDTNCKYRKDGHCNTVSICITKKSYYSSECNVICPEEPRKEQPEIEEKSIS